MKLFNIVITLAGFTTMALGSVASYDSIHDCTAYNKGITACGVKLIDPREIYQCTDSGWDWIGTCFDPKFPCGNGACAPLPAAIESREAECDEGQKRCLTAYDRGHDGIQICKNREWEMLDPCRCNRDPEPQCMPIVSRNTLGPHQCIEGEPKCMLRNKNGNGGTLFRCKDGHWNTQMHCRPSERCHDNPDFSTCSWRGAAAVGGDDDTPTTQVRRDDDATGTDSLFS